MCIFYCYIKIDLIGRDLKKFKKLWKNLIYFFRKTCNSDINMNTRAKRIEIYHSGFLENLKYNLLMFFDAIYMGFSIYQSSTLLFYENIYLFSFNLANTVNISGKGKKKKRFAKKKGIDYRKKFSYENIFGKIVQY